MRSNYTSILLCIGIYILIQPINAYSHTDTTTITVPAGGNTWCANCGDKARTITNAGIQNWAQEDAVFETYVRVSNPGIIKAGIIAKANGKSILRLTIAGTTKEIIIKGDEFKTYSIGEFVIKDTGYIKLSLSGKQKAGKYFADISGYELSGTSINSNTVYVKNNEGNFYYWGRRGPSVHLSYPFTDSINAEWFYNEITVPEKQDIVGSYFMANGFGEGYFGIQVNSSTERRILFSVWSPFSTDDPKSIPEDMRITLLKKGEGVYTGEFGNEGSGGQSYLKYNWQAGTTYKFLLNGKPDGNDNTIYTAFFFAPEKEKWLLIASFKRPKTNTHLKRFHSFLENFIPQQGDKKREVLFGNQWICDSNGRWTELTNAIFTYDNTAAKKYRLDYAGGLKEESFYLKNCGFFNNYTSYKASFTRELKGKEPEINFRDLP